MATRSRRILADRVEGTLLSGSFSFRLHERLLSSEQYTHVRRVGKRGRSAHFGVNFAPNGLPYHRLGLVVQKRYWASVRRNRIKRCLREWFRLHKSLIPLPGKDIVVIARPGAERLSASETACELLTVLSRQG